MISSKEATVCVAELMKCRWISEQPKRKGSQGDLPIPHCQIQCQVKASHTKLIEQVVNARHYVHHMFDTASTFLKSLQSPTDPPALGIKTTGLDQYATP